MALSKENYELANTLKTENAYIRIDTIGGSKHSIHLDVKIYASQQAAQDDLPYIEQKTYSFTPIVDNKSLNYHKQGYEYIKTLSEYADAVDC